MLHPSTKKLIDKLIEMTATSKINWQEGDDLTCFYDTEGYRVTIGQQPSRVVLLDVGGRVLETVSDTLLSSTQHEDGVTYAAKVDGLVSDARRELTGAADVMDKLVSFLDSSEEEVPNVDEPEPEMPAAETSYPDQPEMTSRVAQLADRLHDTSVVEDSVPPVDAEDAPVEEEAPVEAASEAAERVETTAPEDAAEAVEAPEADAEEDTNSLTGAAIFAGAAGAAVAGAAYLATDSVSSDEDDSASEADDAEMASSEEGWSVPETAEAVSEETVEDYVEPEEPVGFSPVEAEDTLPAVDDEVEMSGPTDAEDAALTFSSEETAAPVMDDESAEPVEMADVAPVEPIVHEAPSWGDPSPAVSAEAVTPEDLTTPSYVEETPEPELMDMPSDAAEVTSFVPEMSDAAEGEPTDVADMSDTGLEEATSFASDTVEEVTETFAEPENVEVPEAIEPIEAVETFETPETPTEPVSSPPVSMTGFGTIIGSGLTQSDFSSEKPDDEASDMVEDVSGELAETVDGGFDAADEFVSQTVEVASEAVEEVSDEAEDTAADLISEPIEAANDSFSDSLETGTETFGAISSFSGAVADTTEETVDAAVEDVADDVMDVAEEAPSDDEVLSGEAVLAENTEPPPQSGPELANGFASFNPEPITVEAEPEPESLDMMGDGEQTIAAETASGASEEPVAEEVSEIFEPEPEPADEALAVSDETPAEPMANEAEAEAVAAEAEPEPVEEVKPAATKTVYKYNPWM
ncbi:MAG: hypothetical protein CMK09_10955 [Ponticaulis sp.]|nr:hypothetical protein [Ponticaulis sp.]|tara:strand:+ start:23156 stop:25405 length:2250 start_codon:yes stop_codon:yes gene_type:complete